MNYEYADAYLEINFPDSGNIRRIKKSIIKEISQINDGGGKCHVLIWVQGDSYRFNGTMEDFDKAYKTVYI